MLAIVDDDQEDARHHEGGRENRRHPRQQVRRRSAGHKARHAAPAHAQRPALALLQQDHPDEGDRDQDVDDEQQNEHGEVLVSPEAAGQPRSTHRPTSPLRRWRVERCDS